MLFRTNLIGGSDTNLKEKGMSSVTGSQERTQRTQV